MTENKKKTTKKEVVDENETPINEVKNLMTNENGEKQDDVITETLASEEVDTVTAEDLPEIEDVNVAAKAEDYGFVTEEKKEKRPKRTDPDNEPEKELRVKTEPRGNVAVEDFDWETFESEELRNSPKYKEYESLYDETLSTVAVDEVVIGTVIQMTLREVVINIGYKSEGVVSLNEFRYNPEHESWR